MQQVPRIAIFASGSGSNAQRIAEFFESGDILEVAVIYCNNPGAFVLERARNLSIPAFLFDKSMFIETHKVLDDLKTRKIDWIVLAGFLWLIPQDILKAFPGRIINIHPALLPKYGGKGMYGERVHKAVIEAGEVVSGITIHLVNENYDEGQSIFQATCTLSPGETPESLAGKVHLLEYQYYPEVIRDLVTGKITG